MPTSPTLFFRPSTQESPRTRLGLHFLYLQTFPRTFDQVAVRGFCFTLSFSADESWITNVFDHNHQNQEAFIKWEHLWGSCRLKSPQKIIPFWVKIVGKSKIWNNQKFWKVHNNHGLVITFREMWDLFNVNDAKGLNVFEVENGIVDMTQTGDSFDR